MDNRLALDVYAILKNPHFRVDFDAEDDRVEVVFGGPSVCDQPVNVLSLWLTNPHTALDLGRELIRYGHEFLMTRQGSASTATCDSDGVRQPGASGGERGRDA